MQTTIGEPIDLTDIPPTPISHMSETENLMAESVSKFASDVIAPKVREMDEAEKEALSHRSRAFAKLKAALLD